MGLRWSFVLILLFNSVTAQDSLRVLRTFTPEQAIRNFSVDNLDNLYLLTRSRELIKYDASFQWVGNHRNQVLGPLRQVDVTNPLQLLLFYAENAVLLQLDNMLYATNRFEIGQLNLSENSLVCRSFDNNIWLYDARAFRLRKLANDLRVVVEGEWLQNKIQTTLSPNDFAESDERLYLNDPETGILVFDLYGAYLKTLPITGQAVLNVHQGKIYYREGGALFYYNTQSLQHHKIQLPAGINPKQFRVNRSGLWVFDGEQLFLLAP